MDNTMLQSERISLVKPNLELVEVVRTAIVESQPELEKYLGWVQSSLAEPEKNMAAAIERHAKNTGELRYFIVERNTSTIAGAIGLIIRDAEVPFFEMGYWIRTSKAGNGYVSDAVRIIESYALKELNARRLEIRMAKCNTKSRAVAENAGYHLEAELENERRLPSGELSNTLVFAKCAL